MNVAAIQHALLVRGYALGKRSADGDFGSLTERPCSTFWPSTQLSGRGHQALGWSDARLIVAVEQLIMRLGGVPSGTVDGLFGSQTRVARAMGQTKAGALQLSLQRPPGASCGPATHSSGRATPEGKEFTVKQIDQMHRARGFAQIGTPQASIQGFSRL